MPHLGLSSVIIPSILPKLKSFWHKTKSSWSWRFKYFSFISICCWHFLKILGSRIKEISTFWRLLSTWKCCTPINSMIGTEVFKSLTWFWKNKGSPQFTYIRNIENIPKDCIEKLKKMIRSILALHNFHYLFRII